MAAKLDMKVSFTVYGMVVILLILAACGGLVFEDIASLWATGSPHVLDGAGGRGAWFRDLDILTGGWFTVVFSTAFAAYLGRVAWSFGQFYVAPVGILRCENGQLHLNKGLFVASAVDFADVTSVNLSFDPEKPESRSRDWFWGSWNDRISISIRKPNGRIKKIVLTAGRIVGECDALAEFYRELVCQLRARANPGAKAGDPAEPKLA
jgi:hypothetical protein